VDKFFKSAKAGEDFSAKDTNGFLDQGVIVDGKEEGW
jgi:hypothetical protein